MKGNEMRNYYGTNCGANYTSVQQNLSREQLECLEERKYWCFLLSSIVTFCLSMLLVVAWRIIAHVCCRPKDDSFEELHVRFFACFYLFFGVAASFVFLSDGRASEFLATYVGNDRNDLCQG